MSFFEANDMPRINLQKAHPPINLKVMSDGPLKPSLVELAKAFHQEGTTHVEFVFETSPTIYNRVAHGEIADVLIIQPKFITELVNAGKLVPGEHPVIARVGLGLMGRSDARPVDVSDMESFKKALIDAESLVFNDVASGNYFAKLLKRLGIADIVKDKVVRAESHSVFQQIINGACGAIGVATIPLINVTKGVRLIGSLPAELQMYIEYAAALITTATSPQPGSAFIRFLSSPAARAAFSKTTVESSPRVGRSSSRHQ
jgi:molybdate transport system substrate-binding protein